MNIKTIERNYRTVVTALLTALALTALAALTGCTTLPTNSLESGTLTLTVGPLFRQSLTVAGASQAPDGTKKVANWEGSTSYLGVVTFTQSFHNLTIAPGTAPLASK